MEGAAGPHPMSAEEKTAMEDAASESPVVKDSASPDSQRAPFGLEDTRDLRLKGVVVAGAPPVRVGAPGGEDKGEGHLQ